MIYVAVFDTNILLSGMGWRGKPHRCLELARLGVIEGVTYQELLDELAEKLQTKLNFSASQVLDTITDLLVFLRVKFYDNLWFLLRGTDLNWVITSLIAFSIGMRSMLDAPTNPTASVCSYRYPVSSGVAKGPP